MIERTTSGFDVACDTCPDVWESGRCEWWQLMRALREHGWAYRRVHGEWKHYCPECVQGVDPYWKQKDALT